MKCRGRTAYAVCFRKLKRRARCCVSRLDSMVTVASVSYLAAGRAIRCASSLWSVTIIRQCGNPQSAQAAGSEAARCPVACVPAPCMELQSGQLLSCAVAWRQVTSALGLTTSPGKKPAQRLSRGDAAHRARQALADVELPLELDCKVKVERCGRLRVVMAPARSPAPSHQGRQTMHQAPRQTVLPPASHLVLYWSFSPDVERHLSCHA